MSLPADIARQLQQLFREQAHQMRQIARDAVTQAFGGRFNGGKLDGDAVLAATPLGDLGVGTPDNSTVFISPAGVYSAGSSVTTSVISSTSAKAMSLWNGSSNNAAPANWYTTGYSDSGWSAAVVNDDGTGHAYLIWSENPYLAHGEEALFRQHFTLPAGTIGSVSLTYFSGAVAPGSEGVYINGNLVPGSVGNYTSTTVTIDPSWLTPGASNVIAMAALVPAAASGGYGSVNYSLTVVQQGSYAIEVEHNGTAVGTRPILNIIDSASATATVADNSGNNSVDITPTATGTFAGEVTGTDFKPTGLTGATAAGRYGGTTVSGAPASGTWSKGDWVTDQAGKRWTCTTAGSPGTWAQEPGTGGTAVSSVTANAPLTSSGGTTPAIGLTTPLAQNYGGTGKDTSAATDGQILIGKSSDHSLNLATLTQGSGITITNGAGSVTIAAAPGAGGSGNVVNTGAFGSEPGSPATGDLYFPNDGFSIERYSGSAWALWGPIFPLTKPPSQSTFAWVNQGSATATDSKGGIVLAVPSGLAAGIHGLEKTAPATPYTLTVGFLAAPNLQNQWNVGVFFRDSVSGKIVSFRYYINTSSTAMGLAATTNSSPTVGVANYFAQLFFPMIAPMFWMQISDDGTNRISRISADGQNWSTIHTITRTDYITANRVGFFLDGQGGGNTSMTLLHWSGV